MLMCCWDCRGCWLDPVNSVINVIMEHLSKQKYTHTHPSSLTSGRLLLSAIMSLAIRLNWLILKSSFIFSCSSLGIITAFPISPGASWVRDITAGTQKAGWHSVQSIYNNCIVLFLNHAPIYLLQTLSLISVC